MLFGMNFLSLEAEQLYGEGIIKIGYKLRKLMCNYNYLVTNNAIVSRNPHGWNSPF